MNSDTLALHRTWVTGPGGGGGGGGGGVVTDRDLLIKNMGFYFQCSSSLNKAALTETLEIAM